MSFKAQDNDTPIMIDEQIELMKDALNYHKDRKKRVEEAKESGIEGGLLDRELEAINYKISWYVLRITEMNKFIESHIFNEDLFKQNKYPWLES